MNLTIDSKWLEILKVSGWKTTAIAATCGIFLFLVHINTLPTLPSWATLILSFLGILSTFLALASWGNAIYRFFPLHKWFVHWNDIRRSKKGLVKYIPYMTDKEREIIADLLAKNQKTFTAERDGGHASTLLSRGIVMILVQPGQQVDMMHVTMTIPDPLWDVLVKCKDDFPYIPRNDNKHPWRVNWMER